MPKANVAVLVGERFGSLTPTGGPGEPQRKTPWGEIAWQLGQEQSFAVVADLIVNRLRQEGEITEGVGVHRLVRCWPAMEAWSTTAVRDAFYSSPSLPRLLWS